MAVPSGEHRVEQGSLIELGGTRFHRSVDGCRTLLLSPGSRIDRLTNSSCKALHAAMVRAHSRTSVFVRGAREQPTQLDRRGQLAALVEGERIAAASASVTVNMPAGWESKARAASCAAAIRYWPPRISCARDPARRSYVRPALE